jgi:hypothetical protein
LKSNADKNILNASRFPHVPEQDVSDKQKNKGGKHKHFGPASMDKQKTLQESKSEDPCQAEKAPEQPKVREIGGPTGTEPTRYGDWERRGRCIDF